MRAELKPGDIVVWVEKDRHGTGSLGVVTRVSRDTGVDVDWVSPSPELMRQAAIKDEPDHWLRTGWRANLFEKVGEKE